MKKVAMKIIESGLIVFGVILMIPTVIFLAACEVLFIFCDKLDEWKDGEK